VAKDKKRRKKIKELEGCDLYGSRVVVKLKEGSKHDKEKRADQNNGDGLIGQGRIVNYRGNAELVQEQSGNGW